MNDQVQRAGSSLSSNIGEGFDAESRADKRRYFGYALASTGEGIRLLQHAGATGAVPTAAATEGLRLLQDIKWDLIRLIRWSRR